MVLMATLAATTHLKSEVKVKFRLYKYHMDPYGTKKAHLKIKYVFRRATVVLFAGDQTFMWKYVDI
jgi:hypothetical protein